MLVSLEILLLCNSHYSAIHSLSCISMCCYDLILRNWVLVGLGVLNPFIDTFCAFVCFHGSILIMRKWMMVS